MHWIIFTCAILVQFGLISIDQCYARNIRDGDEMLVNENNLRLNARRSFSPNFELQRQSKSSIFR
jgi:hypothetical protein